MFAPGEFLLNVIMTSKVSVARRVFCDCAFVHAGCSQYCYQFSKNGRASFCQTGVGSDRSGLGNQQSLTCVVTTEEQIRSCGHPEAPVSFWHLTHEFLDRFGLLDCSYLGIQPSASTQDGPEAGGQGVCRAEGRREGSAEFAAHARSSPGVCRADRPCCCRCSVPSHAVSNVPASPGTEGTPGSGWDRAVPGESVSQMFRLPGAPRALRTRPPLLHKASAIRRNRQLEFKLDVLCAHEDSSAFNLGS